MGALGDLFHPRRSAEQIKRAMIRQYFAPDRGPKPWIFATGGAACLVVVLLASWFGLPAWADISAAILAVVLFALAWVLFNERAQRATDEDIDLWRDEDFAAVVERIGRDAAFAAADLMAPNNPIVFGGLPRWPDGDNAGRRRRLKAKRGADGITRYTPPCLTILHFTKDHLLAYQCDLDLFSGQVLNETLDEYFWQDIVSLQIERRSEIEGAAAPDSETEEDAGESDLPALGRHIILRLKTTAGGGLEIALADDTPADPADADGLQIRNTKAIARLRKLLRDRKVKR